jgi:mannosyltransferase OCH1-like enzyme
LANQYEEFRVFSDTDVIAPLSQWSPTLPALFSRIRIPACRSDLARLILLYEYGGLYVDAHIGTAGAERLTHVMERLSSNDLLLFDRHDQHGWEGDCHIVNHALGSRKRSSVLGKVISQAVRNLENHEAAEAAADGHVPYNIFALTGPWNISITLFDRSDKQIRLLREFKDFVHIEVLDPNNRPWPFNPYQHYHYRKPGQHWSERQLVERLFERRSG